MYLVSSTILVFRYNLLTCNFQFEYFGQKPVCIFMLKRVYSSIWIFYLFHFSFPLLLFLWFSCLLFFIVFFIFGFFLVCLFWSGIGPWVVHFSFLGFFCFSLLYILFVFFIFFRWFCIFYWLFSFFIFLLCSDFFLVILYMCGKS